MANGTYTNTELVDTLIVDLNNLPKDLTNGQFIHACAIVAQMGQKLLNLREGIQSDLDNKNKIIEDLKQQLRNAGAEVNDLTAEEFVKKCAEGEVLNNGGGIY